MAINLTRNQIQTPSAPTVQQERQELAVVEYDIQEDRNQLTTRLENSQEVDTLVSQIEVFNLETIVSFGSEAAEEISKCSDTVLNSMNMEQLNESSEMLNTLARIMDKFDIDEIKENPSLTLKSFRKIRGCLTSFLGT